MTANDVMACDHQGASTLPLATTASVVIACAVENPGHQIEAQHRNLLPRLTAKCGPSIGGRKRDETIMFAHFSAIQSPPFFQSMKRRSFFTPLPSTFCVRCSTGGKVSEKRAAERDDKQLKPSDLFFENFTVLPLCAEKKNKASLDRLVEFKIHVPYLVLLLFLAFSRSLTWKNSRKNYL